MTHEGGPLLLTATSAGMSPNQQQFRWKAQTTESRRKPKTVARDAVERVKRGGSVKNDSHVRKIVQDTAEARYYPQGKLNDLSLGALVTLALSFTTSEWAAVNRDPTLLQETLDYFKTGDFQIDRWWTYWRNLQLEQPKLAKLFLLEIICDYWKDDVTDLIDGVRHISNGLPVENLIEYASDEPVPKRRKRNPKYVLPLNGQPDKDSKFSTLDAKTLPEVTGKRPEPHSDWKAVGGPSQFPINNQARESLSNTSLNTTNTRGVDEQLRTEEIISDTSRLERTGVGAISALLNHDSNIPAAVPATMQGSLAGSGSDDQQSDTTRVGVGTTLLRAIRFEKHTLHEIIVQRPNDILGGIWFGSPQGYPPCVLLRLPRALDTIVKPSGQEVYVPGPSPGASSTVTRIYLIKLECFKQMIQRDGFGMIFWNECGEEAFVTMEVVDQGLVEDFIRGAVPD